LPRPIFMRRCDGPQSTAVTPHDVKTPAERSNGVASAGGFMAIFGKKRAGGKHDRSAMGTVKSLVM
jgi:hypothetical protein